MVTGMDLDEGSRYLVTGVNPGFSGPPVEMTYIGQRREDGSDFYWFRAAQDEWRLGVPEHLIGKNFRIEAV